MVRVRSQVLAEYAMFIMAIVAALVGMQVYFSRSLQGRHKYYTDYMAMGADQFSPTSSRYFKMTETLPFGTERTRKNPDVGSTDEYFTYEEDQDHRITRVVSGNGQFSGVSGENFFSPSAPAEMRTLFSGVPAYLDYSVSNIASTVDDFFFFLLASEGMFE